MPDHGGTGSEVTGITVFDLLSLKAKTGIASHALRPTEALVDPDCTASLPPEVVASAGLDVLSHALESFTARPYVRRPAPERPSLRPMSQGVTRGATWAAVRRCACGSVFRACGARCFG